MSLIRRKAIVNYKVSYMTSTGTYGCYESTKMMDCNLYGNVTPSTIDVWQKQLCLDEKKSLDCPDDPSEYDGVNDVSIIITGFTKLDV